MIKKSWARACVLLLTLSNLYMAAQSLNTGDIKSVQSSNPPSGAARKPPMLASNGSKYHGELLPGHVPAESQGQGQELSISNLNNIRYVTTAEDWHQQPPGSLHAGLPATITLSPCPRGIDGRDNYGIIYITDSQPSLSEPVQMTGAGTCRSGASSGTITLTSRNSHSSGYTIGSASSGIYETLAAQRNNQIPGQPGYGSNGNAYIVTRPATGGNAGGVAYAYKVKGSIRIPLNNVFWDAKGSVLDCSTRDACIDVDSYGPLVLDGLRMVSDLDINGWPLAATECDTANSSGFDPGHRGMTTITTATPHGVQVGDMVDVLRTDNSHYWGGSVSTNAGVTRVVAISEHKVYYPDHNCNNGGVGYPTAKTPGYINVLNAPILDNNNVRLTDFDLGKPGNGNTLFPGHFNEGMTILNDQAAIIDGFSAGGLTSGAHSACTTANPYCGSLIYAPGPFLNAAVLWIKHANLGLSCSANGIWDLSGNTVHISDSVVQGQPQFGMVLGNRRGGYGNITLTDVYSEGGACVNPDFGANSSMGLYIYGMGKWTGGEGPQGAIPSFARGGSLTYYYWLIVTDPVHGSSAPLYFGQGSPAGTSQEVFWPRVPSSQNGSPTYAVLRTTKYYPTPTLENCLGGSVSACGLVAKSLPQCDGLACSYMDNLKKETASASANIPGNPTYIPDVMFWPGGLILGGGGKFQWDDHNLLAGALSLAGDAAPASSTPTLAGNNPTGYVQALGGNVTLLDEKNSNTLLNTKGRVIVERPYGSRVYQGHYVTLVDSDPLANLSSATKRTTLAPSDTYIGNDVPNAPLNGAGLALGAPVSITEYINAAPDGDSWQERLTAIKKETRVPTQFDGPVSMLVACNGCSPFSLPEPKTDDFNRSVLGTLTLTSRSAGATWIGAWDPSTSYIKGNVATVGGTTYFATEASKSQQPPNPAYWTNLTLGPNWTTLLGTWAILPSRVVGGKANYSSFTSLQKESGIGRAYAYYSGANFAADQYIQATVSPANSVIGICVRMSASRPINAYCAITGSGRLALARFIQGGESDLYSGTQIMPMSTVKLMAQANNISLYVNGVLQAMVNDTSIGSGHPGFYGQNLVTPENLINDVYLGSATWTGLVGTATGMYEAGILRGSEKTYTNRQTLMAGGAIHSLANGFSFTSADSYGCSCTDQSAPNACQAIPITGNKVRVGGIGTDVVWLSCSGH